MSRPHASRAPTGPAHPLAAPGRVAAACLSVALGVAAPLRAQPAAAPAASPAPAPAPADTPAATAAPAADTSTLPAVRVRAAPTPGGDYSGGEVQGNRLGQELMETPRAISVLPRALIEDQAPAAEADLMRNVAGINRYNNYGGSYTGFVLRGLWADNGSSYLRNGMRWLHLMEPMMFNLERIEVIKGPNAIDYGQSTPGGFINYVTRQPQETTARSIKLGLGSDRERQAEIDLTGAVDDQARLLYRLTAGYERGGDFTDQVEPKRRGAAAAVSWRPGPDTRVNLSAELNRIELPTNPGIPVPDPSRLQSADELRLRNFYGEPLAVFEGKGDFYAAEWLQTLAPGWTLRTAFARNEFLRVNPSMWLSGLTDTGEVTRQVYWSPHQAQADNTLQLELRGELQTGPLRHKLMFGADQRLTKGLWASYMVVDLAPVSVRDPVPTGDPLPAWAGAYGPDSQRARGFFVQDRIDFGNGWGLQLGLRRDSLKDRISGETSSRTSPNASVTWQPDDASLLYLSYASSFEPNWYVQLEGGGSPPPSQGKQFELGAKRSWLDGKLQTTAALFDLRKTNIPVDIGGGSPYSRLSGEVRVRGLELEASGRPLPWLEVVGQAGFLDPEVAKDTLYAGKRPPRTVRNTASLWAKATLPGALNQWYVGGGVFYTGKTTIDSDNTTELPAYTVFDATAGWQPTPALRVALTVRNLTDRRYYVDADGFGGEYSGAYPGRPRSVLVTTSFNF